MRRKALSALLLWCLAGVAAQAQVPTSNVLYRVLRIRTAGSTGSAFTIEVDGKQYLITARHLLKDFGNEGEVELWIAGRWSKVRVRAIYPSKEVVDVAALDLGRPVTITLPLEPSSGGLTLGQQVYFLGYPYGLGTTSSAPAPPGFGELPFLKSGIVSALDDRDPEASILYLDGQNNPGRDPGAAPGGSCEGENRGAARQSTSPRCRAAPGGVRRRERAAAGPGLSGRAGSRPDERTGKPQYPGTPDGTVRPGSAPGSRGDPGAAGTGRLQQVPEPSLGGLDSSRRPSPDVPLASGT